MDMNMFKTQIVAFLILAMMIFGCASTSRIEYPSSLGNAKSGDLTFKPGIYKTKSNEYKADFGTLVVPENRENPNSRLIELPLIRIHASNKNSTEPIFLFAGGPGGRNVFERPPIEVEYLFSNHDFAMVGYRGADGSVKLDCPEVTNAVEGVGDDVLGEESLKNMGEALSNCAARLQKEGVDLDGYTIMEVIEDMESARIALGYERINLFSMSYGTRVAYLYGVKHPSSIYRSVMIGVNPPGHFVWEPATIDSQLNYYADLWAKDTTLLEKSTDLFATMRNVTHNMPKNWLIFEIDPGKVSIITFALLYHRSTAPLVFDAYTSAEKGDASGLALMSMFYDLRTPKVIWGENASKAVSADFDSTRDYFSEMAFSHSAIGSPLAKALWGPFSFGYRWPIKSIPEEFRTLQHSAVQTLLISGSVDFSSPKESADKLLPYLSKGKHIVFSEMGHTGDIFRVNPKATELLLTSFYDTGVPNGSLNTYVPMDFNVNWGFPKIARVGLGVTVGLTTIILGGLSWLLLH